MSTKTLIFCVDKSLEETYNVLNDNKREVIKLAKGRMTENNSYVEREKRDSEELIEILERVPPERKSEVLGIVKGFALCAESHKTQEAV